MTLETVRKQADNLLNKCYRHRMYNISYTDVINLLIDRAREKKQYKKISLLNDLLSEN